MPDDAPTSTSDGTSLDDLERRLASFESATKRLNRTVGGMADAEPTAAPGHTSPPRPATRRLSESSAPRSEEISGLRPAVQLQGPQTGALTARTRVGTGPVAGTPGFTSAYGKPAIAAVPVPQPTAQPASGMRSQQTAPRQVWRWIALGAVAILLLGLAALPRLFPVLTDAAVWSEERTVTSTATGMVDAVFVRVDDQIVAGQALARIAGTDQLSPQDGTVARLLVMSGARIALNEPVAMVAAPDSRRVVVALPPNLEAAVGDRVRIELLRENRMLDGAVESVLAAGAPGPWPGNGTPPRRAVLQAAPSATLMRPGQSARVAWLGNATSGRQLAWALRQILPW